MKLIKEDEDKFSDRAPKNAPPSKPVSRKLSPRDRRVLPKDVSSSEKFFKGPQSKKDTGFTFTPDVSDGEAAAFLQKRKGAPPRGKGAEALIPIMNAKSEKISKSCNQDLYDNLGVYATIGTLQAIMLWPITMAIGTRTVSALKIAKHIFTPASTIAGLPDTMRAGMAAIKEGGIKKLPSKGWGSLRRLVMDIVKPIPETFKTSIAMIDTIKAAGSTPTTTTVKSIFGNTIKGGFNIAKTVILLALFAYAGIRGIEALNDDDVPRGSVAQGIISFLEYLVFAELVLEQFVLRLNEYQISAPDVFQPKKYDMKEECRFQNTVIAGVLAAPILALTKGGAIKGWKAAFGSKALRSSGDDLATLIQRERQLQIEALDSKVISSLTNKVSQLGGEYKITPEQVKAYYKALTEAADGPSGIEAARKVLGRILDEDAAAKLHTILQKDVEKVGTEFLEAYRVGVSKNATEAVGVLQKAQGKVQATKQALIAQSRNLGQLLDDATLTPRVNPFAASDEIVNSATSGSRFAQKIPKTFEELASLANNLDDALLSGKISPIEALQIYNKSFQPIISRFGDELVIFFDSIPGLTRISSQKSLEALFENLKLLNKNDDFFKNLITKLKNIKGFNSVSSRTTKQLQNLDADAAGIKRILTQEILKNYPAASADDVVRLGNELVNFNNKVNNALKQNKLLLAADIGISVGITTYVVANVLNQNRRTDDVLSWTKGNLARHLAYEEYGPISSLIGADETNQKALNILFADNDGLFNVDVAENKQILRTIYRDHIYKNLDAGTLTKIIDLMEDDDPNVAAEINMIVLKHANDLSYKLAGDGNLRLKYLITQTWAPGTKAQSASQGWSTFNDKWTPILVKIMALNSSIRYRIQQLRRDRSKRAEFYKIETDDAKREYIRKQIFNPADLSKDFRNLRAWVKSFKKNAQEAKSMREKNKDNVTKENKNYLANNDLLKELINEQLKESQAENYSSYPYISSNSDLQEPTEDFLKDWKSFTDEMVQDSSRDRAVTFAKLLVKNLELLDELMILIGKNQSVASEVMRQCREKYES